MFKYFTGWANNSLINMLGFLNNFIVNVTTLLYLNDFIVNLRRNY